MEREVKVVSWNVDGLAREYLSLRTKAQCEELLHEMPDIILLQEIVSDTVDIFRNHLGKKFRFFTSAEFFVQYGREVPPFYNIIAWNKDTIKRVGKPGLERFSERGNHRHLLSCGFRMRNAPEKSSHFHVATSHYESSRSGSNDRKKQFQISLERLIDSTQGEGHYSLCIFGGDTNLREPEAKEILAQPGMEQIKDCWSHVCPASDKDTKYTWDMVRNRNSPSSSQITIRTRYDRMLFANCRSGCCPDWYPIFWKLIGTTKLSSINLHPSDHFGISSTFLLFPSEHSEPDSVPSSPVHIPREVIDLT